MSDFENIHTNDVSGTVGVAQDSVRSLFIRKTYLHLALAILAFVVVLGGLFSSGFALFFVNLVFSTSFSWLIVIGLFVGVSYIADKWARSSTSLPTQYLGLGLYVLAEAIVFVPLLYIAVYFAPDTLLMATGLTGFLFGGLTLLALITKTDYSFLRSFLTVGGFVALGLIVMGAIFGFSLGLWFSGAMIIFASASILYNTSSIVKDYQPTQYVAASLSLFASVALLFYYILTFLLQFTNRN